MNIRYQLRKTSGSFDNTILYDRDRRNFQSKIFLVPSWKHYHPRTYQKAEDQCDEYQLLTLQPIEVLMKRV